MNEFTINVVQDPSKIININNLDQAVSLSVIQDQETLIQVQDDINNVLLNPSVFYNGINIVYLSGVSGELLHNTFGDLQGGTTGQYYHLSSGQYFNLVTGIGSFYPNNNPSGFITGVDLSPYATITYVTGISGQLQAQITVLNNQTGSYVLNSQTGQFYSSSNPSGFITGINNIVYTTGDQIISGAKTFSNNLTVNGGDLFVDTSNNRVGINTTSPTATLDVNGSGIFRSGLFISGSRPTVNSTGILLSGEATTQAYVTGISGGLQTQITTLNNATGSYVLNSQTGVFYPRTNPSGYITGVDLSFSGNYYTKTESESRYVNTTGAETILGNKTFHDNVYINNLYVTGLETIVNTTNTNVASNYIMLNLTGGSVDGGIFFVTGSGLTGINDSGGIIGFDHSDEFKFGISTRASDLSTLNTIASVEQMTGISGGLQTQISTLNNQTGSYVLKIESGQFYPNSNPSGFITGVDLSSYATQVYVTGISGNLQTQITDLSNATGSYVLSSQTGQFYANSNPSGFITGINNLVYTTGDQTINGSLTTTGPTVFNSTSVTAPNLTPSASNSLMTRSSTEEFLLWTPNIMQYFPVAGSTTNGGFSTITAGQSANIGLATQSSGTTRLTLVSDWQFSNAAGSSLRFDKPFKIRVPMNCNMNYPDTTGQAACRVYVGSNGSFTLPYAGRESYPTGTRGVGVEWRKASGSFQQEFRLFARNGTSTTTGQFIATNYTGFGPISNSNSKFYDLLLTFNVDTPTNPIVNLYGSAWLATDPVPSRTSSTPILTLSGSGVPTGSASVATNWGRVEAAVVGDNGLIPLQASTTLNYFRTIYLQQA